MPLRRFAPRSLLLPLLVCGALGAADCGAREAPLPPAAKPSVQARPAAPADRRGDPALAELTAAAAPGQALSYLQPVTVRLTLPPPLRDLVGRLGTAPTAGRPAPALRLEIGGLVPPAVPVGIRVFVNDPSAGATTPLSDPHYAGSFTFGETAGSGAYGASGKAAAAASFLLDPSRALAALPPAQRLLGGTDLAVTLVATPLRPHEDLTAVTVPFAKVELSALPATP